MQNTICFFTIDDFVKNFNLDDEIIKIMTGFNDIDNLHKMSCEITNILAVWDQQLSAIKQENQRVMLSCSGGLDSTVLFHLFLEFQKLKKNFYFDVIHFNFKLRGEESNADQAFIEKLSSDNCIKIKTVVVDPKDIQKKAGKSTQEWARDIRYRHYGTHIQEGHVVALAHHQDDLAENFLLRAARGKNIGHVAGMTSFNDGYWRPLLIYSKMQLKKIALQLALTHREDSSNDKMDYSRNKIRQKIIPDLEAMIPGATQNLVSLALDWQEMMTQQRSQLTTELQALENNAPSAWLPVSCLLNKSPLLSLEMLQLIIAKRVKNTTWRCSRDFFQALRTKLESDKNSKKQWSFNLSRGLIFRFANGLFTVYEGRAAQKQIRFQQHRRNLSSRSARSLLSPNAVVEFFDSIEHVKKEGANGQTNQ